MEGPWLGERFSPGWLSGGDWTAFLYQLDGAYGDEPPTFKQRAEGSSSETRIPLRGATVILEEPPVEILLELGEGGTPQKAGGGAKIRLRLKNGNADLLKAWFMALRHAVAETHSFYEDSALLDVHHDQSANPELSERYAAHSDALRQIESQYFEHNDIDIWAVAIVCWTTNTPYRILCTAHANDAIKGSIQVRPSDIESVFTGPHLKALNVYHEREFAKQKTIVATVPFSVNTIREQSILRKVIPDLEGDMAFTVGTSRFGWDKDPKLSVVVWHENMTDPAETDPKKVLSLKSTRHVWRLLEMAEETLERVAPHHSEAELDNEVVAALEIELRMELAECCLSKEQREMMAKLKSAAGSMLGALDEEGKRYPKLINNDMISAGMADGAAVLEGKSVKLESLTWWDSVKWKLITWVCPLLIVLFVGVRIYGALVPTGGGAMGKDSGGADDGGGDEADDSEKLIQWTTARAEEHVRQRAYVGRKAYYQGVGKKKD